MHEGVCAKYFFAWPGRFVERFGKVNFFGGGYWLAKFVLDASSWLTISRPRPALPRSWVW